LKTIVHCVHLQTCGFMTDPWTCGSSGLKLRSTTYDGLWPDAVVGHGRKRKSGTAQKGKPRHHPG